MNGPETASEILTKSSRSEGAKRMWERRKAEKGEAKLPMTSTMIQVKEAPSIKAWIYHVQWFGSMAVIIGCFWFMHNEINRANKRLDKHIEAINKRSDEVVKNTNQRVDNLHKELYDLLKEMKKGE